MRAAALGQDRCACMISPAGMVAPTPDRRLAGGAVLVPEPDRRGFLQRLREALSSARLREKPLAVAVIQIDDISELGRAIAPGVSEEIVRGALRSLLELAATRPAGEPQWNAGLLKENRLALWIDTADRERIEACMARLCNRLREPVELGQAQFQLVLHAGVAILGLDATSPQVLVDHACVAAAEARPAAATRAFFFSDTLKMKSLARLDIARQLRMAIAASTVPACG